MFLFMKTLGLLVSFMGFLRFLGLRLNKFWVCNMKMWIFFLFFEKEIDWILEKSDKDQWVMYTCLFSNTMKILLITLCVNQYIIFLLWPRENEYNVCYYIDWIKTIIAEIYFIDINKRKLDIYKEKCTTYRNI